MRLHKALLIISLVLASLLAGHPQAVYARAEAESVVWFIHGSGDSVENIPELGDGLFIARIHGNLTGRYFSVTTYGSFGNQLDLLVNTGGSYFGVVPFNFDAYNIFDISSGLIEVKAASEWSIEVMKLTSLDFAYNSQTVLGYGDSVFYVKGSALTASVVGNKNSKYFSVSVVGLNGDSVASGLLVNTSDPYQGNVRLPLNKDGIIVIVKSFDTWGIGFNSSKKGEFFDTSTVTLKTNPYSPFKDIFVTPTVTVQPTVTPTAIPQKTISSTVTPQQTPSVTATPTRTVNSNVIAGTVNRDANLRSGPGTNHKIAGGLKAGQKVVIIDDNPDGSWLKLDSGAWIAAFLVTQERTSQPAPSATPTPSG